MSYPGLELEQEVLILGVILRSGHVVASKLCDRLQRIPERQYLEVCFSTLETAKDVHAAISGHALIVGNRPLLEKLEVIDRMRGLGNVRDTRDHDWSAPLGVRGI